jgi:hypothetical protein
MGRTIYGGKLRGCTDWGGYKLEGAGVPEGGKVDGLLLRRCHHDITATHHHSRYTPCTHRITCFVHTFDSGFHHRSLSNFRAGTLRERGVGIGAGLGFGCCFLGGHI